MRLALALLVVAAMAASGCGDGEVRQGKVSADGLAALDSSRSEGEVALGAKVIAGSPKMLVIYPVGQGPASAPDRGALNVDAAPLAQRFGPDAAATLAAAPGHALTNAPSSGEPKPLIIFAPGAGMPGAAYRLLAEQLAARGMIVALLSPDGSPPASEKSYRAIERSFVAAWRVLRGRTDLGIDWQRVVLGGHSLGGAAAVGMLRAIPARAAVNLDGDYLFDSLHRAPDRPILYISSHDPAGGSTTLERRARDWALVGGGRSDARHIEMRDARHHDFTDLSVLPRALISDKGQRQFGPAAPGVIEARTANAIADFVMHATARANASRPPTP